jgi:hypothetical protein
MVQKNIRNYKDVSNVIRNYLENSQTMLAEANKNE